MVSDNIADTTTSIMVDEEGTLRVKGKNETDHNTISINIKVNKPRKPIFRENWAINNKPGWEKFNSDMATVDGSNTSYNQFESHLKKKSPPK